MPVLLAEDALQVPLLDGCVQPMNEEEGRYQQQGPDGAARDGGSDEGQPLADDLRVAAAAVRAARHQLARQYAGHLLEGAELPHTSGEQVRSEELRGSTQHNRKVFVDRKRPLAPEGCGDGEGGMHQVKCPAGR